MLRELYICIISTLISHNVVVAVTVMHTYDYLSLLCTGTTCYLLPTSYLATSYLATGYWRLLATSY